MLQSIRPTTKTLVLLDKIQEPKKKQWFVCEKHKNQQAKHWFSYKKKDKREKTF